MIWFLLAAGVATVAVLAVLLRPLLGRQRGGAGAAEPVAVLYRRQLAAIDEELTEGRLASDEAAAAQAEITRRLLASAAAGNPAAPPTPSSDAAEDRADGAWRFAAAVTVAGLLPAAALAVYFAVGTPAAIEGTAQSRAAVPHGAAELAAAADKIKAHLATAPGDLKGWTLLGRTLASLGRVAEARDAYRHAIDLAPGDAGLHAELGEVLVLAAQGAVTPEAAAEFAKAPDDPRSRYYDAEAALQRGDPAAAKQKLQALLASAPADAPWRQSVAARLAEISANGGKPAGSAAGQSAAGQSAAGQSAAGPGPAGPSAADVAAAQAMSPAEREAMIRGMVDRLARRLDRQPDDKAGWERLAHAYDVLGEPDKATAARARAAALPSAPPAAPPAKPAN